ncbi:hypothetical protein D3C73_1670820 [compost metagenome]
MKGRAAASLAVLTSTSPSSSVMRRSWGVKAIFTDEWVLSSNWLPSGSCTCFCSPTAVR